MSSRRADAAPDNLERAVRSARTRRAIVITTRAHVAQCFGARFLANSSEDLRRILICILVYPILHTGTLQGLQMEAITAAKLFC
ncbi:MAG: hypothetical protein AUI02_06055 [Acidobacteria bacterium 13_2_20CM_2_57_12]|nr:MAG: hypothetical protein AUI02_06055 [Acidobacteria bacterium 13_2_20CM_2_57_12]